MNQQLYAGYDTREGPDVEILPHGGKSLQVLARAAPGETRRRLRAEPVRSRPAAGDVCRMGRSVRTCTEPRSA
jgi:hypothetical protein